jgi:cation diffusion facilitator family transporter
MSGKKTSVALLSVASNSVLIILKIAVGLLIGSVSVISEAIHSGIDLLAAVIALFAVTQSGREADDRHPYGHGKYENVSGTIEAVLIFVAAIWIIYEAIHKFLRPGSVSTPLWGVLVMFVSAALNFAISRRLFKVGRETESVALQADAWHLRTDVYTSLGVMVGMGVIAIGRLAGADLNWLDPTVAILVALMIMRAAYNLTKEAGRDLLDVALPTEDLDWIREYVAGLGPVVCSFHHMRTRRAGSRRFIDFHLAVQDTMSVAASHELGDRICEEIKKRIPDSSIHIHVEPCDYTCKESCETGCLLPEARRHPAETTP